MAIEQLNFDMQTKEEEAIEFIKRNEPIGGYQVCISAGGKDSEVTEHLVRSAGVAYEATYSLTGIDPPEAVQFLKKHYPEVTIVKSELTVWRWIEKKGLPRRQARWCCAKLKEYSGKGRTVITGMRAEESPRRAKRGRLENGLNGKTFVNPIFNWNEMEVWQYIEKYHLPYCELYDIPGWDRLGCIMCPMATWRRTLFEWQRYPKIAMAWYRAACRYYARMSPSWKEKNLKSAELFKSEDEYWWWWVSRGETTVETVKYNAQKLGLTITK